MSTRCVVQIFENQGSTIPAKNLYHHNDGYPSNMLQVIENGFMQADQSGESVEQKRDPEFMFESLESVDSEFVDETGEDWLHDDIEFYYAIYGDVDGWLVRCHERDFDRNWDFDDYMELPIKDEVMHEFSAFPINDEGGDIPENRLTEDNEFEGEEDDQVSRFESRKAALKKKMFGASSLLRKAYTGDDWYQEYAAEVVYAWEQWAEYVSSVDSQQVLDYYFEKYKDQYESIDDIDENELGDIYYGMFMDALFRPDAPEAKFIMEEIGLNPPERLLAFADEIKGSV